MSRIETERQKLALANHHIDQALRLIGSQEVSLEKQREVGMDTCAAEALLKVMREVLESFLAHRRLIEHSIENASRGTGA
jgi:hypothetical protein